MKLYKDVVNLILDFIPKYKLRDWMIGRKLNYSGISRNPSPGILSILKENPFKIDWNNLCCNNSSEAMFLVEEDIEKNDGQHIDSVALCQNTSPKAISIIDKILSSKQFEEDDIDWWLLSANPSAVHLLLKYPRMVERNAIHSNVSPEAIKLIEKNIDNEIENEIDLYCLGILSGNPGAGHLLKKYIEKGYDAHVDWSDLSGNTSPDIIPILEANLDKVDWDILSQNPSAISIIKKSIENKEGNVHWDSLCENESPGVVQILLENFSKIDWNVIVGNPATIQIVEDNLDKVNLDNNYYLCCNPSIFVPYRDPVLFDILMKVEIH